MKTLVVIPARGGSKGIPNKNLADLGGKPLIAWSVDIAHRCEHNVMITTDCEQVQDLAREWGVDCLQRPHQLALDNTPDLPVFKHVIDHISSGGLVYDIYEAIVHLRPTTPFRDADRINEAIQLLRDNPDADSVRSISPVSEHPEKMWFIEQEDRDIYTRAHPYEGGMENLPRQELPQVYIHNGYVDVIRTETITEKNSMTGNIVVPYIMDERVIDIDTIEDLEYARYTLL